MQAVQYSRPADLSKISHVLLADGWHEIDGVEADLDDPDKIIFRQGEHMTMVYQTAVLAIKIRSNRVV
jgi:hypothetical protein